MFACTSLSERCCFPWPLTFACTGVTLGQCWQWRSQFRCHQQRSRSCHLRRLVARISRTKDVHKHACVSAKAHAGRKVAHFIRDHKRNESRACQPGQAKPPSANTCHVRPLCTSAHAHMRHADHGCGRPTYFWKIPVRPLWVVVAATFERGGPACVFTRQLSARHAHSPRWLRHCTWCEGLQTRLSTATHSPPGYPNTLRVWHACGLSRCRLHITDHVQYTERTGSTRVGVHVVRAS